MLVIYAHFHKGLITTINNNNNNNNNNYIIIIIIIIRNIFTSAWFTFPDFCYGNNI